MALEEITRSAFYLRFEQGKYYASKQPTINSVLPAFVWQLAQIRWTAS